MPEQHQLTVVIPYRDRPKNLKNLLSKLPHFLPETAQIVVAEQIPGGPWNKGQVMNAAVRHLKNSDVICMHDVDMVPLDGADYHPQKYPTLLCSYASQWGNRMKIRFFGGVTMYGRDEFIMANGFGNDFWGWGGEDDDQLRRFEFIGMPPTRRVNRYISQPHPPCYSSTNTPLNQAMARAFLNPMVNGYAQCKATVKEVTKNHLMVTPYDSQQ